MFTNDDRRAMMSKMPEEVLGVYGSLETAKFLGAVMQKYEITDNRFIDYVGDTMLNLYPRKILPKLLSDELKVSQEATEKITLELESLFERVTRILPQANPDLKEKLELRPEGVPIGGAAGQKRENTDPEAVKPLTREELMSALAAKRTMASDIEAMRQKSTTPQPQVGYGAAGADGEKPV